MSRERQRPAVAGPGVNQIRQQDAGIKLHRSREVSHRCDCSYRLDLLASFVGVDLDALALLDSMGQREATTWDERMARGLSPIADRPLGDHQ